MNGSTLIHAELTRSVIGAFYEVYNTLGFGFVESVYSQALEIELTMRGHKVAREVPVRVQYKGHELRQQRIDLLVDNTLVVENKASERIPAGSPQKLLNYLRATELEVGLLMHFGPKASYFRVVSSNSKQIRANPRNPRNPPTEAL